MRSCCPAWIRSTPKCTSINDLRDTERPVDTFSDQIAANAIDEGVNAKAVAVQAKRQGFRLER